MALKLVFDLYQAGVIVMRTFIGRPRPEAGCLAELLVEIVTLFWVLKSVSWIGSQIVLVYVD